MCCKCSLLAGAELVSVIRTLRHVTSSIAIILAKRQCQKVSRSRYHDLSISQVSEKTGIFDLWSQRFNIYRLPSPSKADSHSVQFLRHAALNVPWTGQCMIMPVGKGPGQVGKVVVPASCNGNILYLEYISVYERGFFFQLWIRSDGM